MDNRIHQLKTSRSTMPGQGHWPGLRTRNIETKTKQNFDNPVTTATYGKLCKQAVGGEGKGTGSGHTRHSRILRIAQPQTHSTSLRFNLILSSHLCLCLKSVSLLRIFQPKTFTYFYFHGKLSKTNASNWPSASYCPLRLLKSGCFTVKLLINLSYSE